MDKKVKRIRPKDYELSTVQDNLANAVDQLLGSSTPSSQTGPLVLSPSLKNVAGPGTALVLDQPGLTVNGNPTDSTGNAVVLGNPATETTPQYPAAVKLYGSISATGPIVTDSVIAGNSVQALTVNSSAGFKAPLAVGSFYSTAPVAGAFTPTAIFLVNQANVTNFIYFNYRWQYPGSIVGVSCNKFGPNNGSITLRILKNGAVNSDIGMGVLADGATYWAAYPKSAQFAAGDTMTVQVATSGTGVLAVQPYLTLEMSA